MFFPNLIASIGPNSKVLEIGPGATPHSRSDAFLELNYANSNEKMRQFGGDGVANFGGRPVHFYDGGRFPFENNQFDYVICSHVIEHVGDPSAFLSEVFRVGSGRGYIEYPLATYEYLYDFDVHLHFVKFDFAKNILKYIPKKDTNFKDFSAISSLFHKSLELGWDDLCAANKNLFFEGFEFHCPFFVEKESDFEKMRPSTSIIFKKPLARKFFGRILNKLSF